MPPRPTYGVHLVVDRDDDVDLLRDLADLNTPEHGTVMVLCDSHMHSHRLLLALLRAMGRRWDASAAPRDDDRAEHLVSIWLDALSVTDIFIGFAQSLDATAASVLGRLAAGRGIWLLAHGRVDLRSAQTSPIDTRPIADLRRRCDALQRARQNNEASLPRPFPRIPLNDFPTFLPACQELLGDSDASRVTAAVEASTWVTARALPAGQGEIDIDTVLTHLATATTSFHERLACLRGAQLALARFGWYLEVDVAAFRRYIGRSKGLSASLIQALHRFAQPQVPALFVVHALSGAGGGALRAMATSDVAPDGANFLLVGRRFQVPTTARPFLRAQFAARSATESSLFFAAPTHHQSQATAHSLAMQLEKASAQLGTGFYAEPGERSIRVNGWTAQAGLRLHSLTWT